MIFISHFFILFKNNFHFFLCKILGKFYFKLNSWFKKNRKSSHFWLILDPMLRWTKGHFIKMEQLLAFSSSSSASKSKLFLAGSSKTCLARYSKSGLTGSSKTCLARSLKTCLIRSLKTCLAGSSKTCLAGSSKMYHDPSMKTLLVI